MLLGKGIGYIPFQGILLEDHMELLLIGWVFQFVFGIGFWIFPRADKKRKYELSAWLSFYFFNAGLILFLTGAPLAQMVFHVHSASLISSVFRFLPLAGESLVVLGLIFFIFPIWVRVQGISQVLEKYREKG